MLTKKLYDEACGRALKMLETAGIKVTDREKAEMQVAEYGLNMLSEIGLQLIVYLNTERCCAKELILFPLQTCPEHRHPAIEGTPGKEETFRCRWGKVYLYVSGTTTPQTHAKAPLGKEKFFTVWHEIELNPREQYTLQPDTLHWFQAGSDGAIVSEFSTRSRDECDIYTDPAINPGLRRSV